MTSRIFCMRALLAAALCIIVAAPAAARDRAFHWTTVVNNNDLIPPLYLRNFNSYNQPSVNARGVVVMRARSRGGPPLGPATHGIYTRDMSIPDSPIVRILDRSVRVPKPNNLGTTFVETPSFPRIDIDSDTIATRGNHQPVHRYNLGDGSETRAGTTGIYTNPFGELVTGHAKLGHVPGMEHFRVPEFNGIHFEVFPGAPAVSEGSTIVFKGNFTAAGYAGTGVYFRTIGPGETGGDDLSVLIANSADTLIPGTTTIFGSTAPPSAARGKAVFAGFDNEWAPTLGGIYVADLEFQPELSTLASIGQSVPGLEAQGATFNDFGEALAFDGRFVGFWASWGDEVRTVRLYCPTEGNKDRIAYCNQQLVCRDSGQTRGDPNSICDDGEDPRYGTSCYTERQVPVNQGIFVHDIEKGRTQLVALTSGSSEDFLFWNYAGKTPCSGKGHAPEGGHEDGESVRWRSSAFVAVSGHGAAYRIAFKSRSRGDGAAEADDSVDTIYVAKGPGQPPRKVVIDTTMDGQSLDPEAPPGSKILELGLEREGLRGSWLAISAKMGLEGGEEEDDMAGVYVTRIR